MDSHGIILLLWTLGILVCLGVLGYAVDDLHEVKRNNNDDLDRELRELIGEEK